MCEYEIVNVVICYNNGYEVTEYIDKMKYHSNINNVCFVITVNAWTEEDKQIVTKYIEASSIHILLFQPHRNLGYMNGLIAGYRFYRNNHERPLYVVMSNTDIEIPDKEYYRNLLNKEYHSSIGCIGPSVFVKEKKTYDNPVCENRRSLSEVDRIIRTFSNPLIGGTYYYLSTLKGNFIREKKTSSRYVYEVHGCYFILSGNFADAIQNLEYGVFLYSEEAYIAELILKNGMKTFYDSTLEVVHLEHSTTKFVKCTMVSKYIHDSMLYIKNEFYKEGQNR